MTRNGKIARLPRPVREQLNRRLDDGELGKALVAWLNALPEVRDTIKRDFHGKLITEQNLSEWRKGGFHDWLHHQEARESVRVTAEEAQELAEDAGPMPLSETFSATVSLLLARLVRNAGRGTQSTPEERRELLTLIREWTAVRMGDQKAARLKMDHATWVSVQARWALIDKARAELASERLPEQAQINRPPDWLTFRSENPTESNPIRPDPTQKNLQG